MLTVDEAAAILRIGRFAVYDAVKRGQIPGMKIGRSLRISKAQLREMMEGRKE
jgi:putative molybdopterin biosynthesis protein